MKTRALLVILSAITSVIAFEVTGQVGISDTGTLLPDSNAVFELGSVSKGALLPRHTTAQIKAIYLPPDGLLAYNTDSSMFFYYDSYWNIDGKSAGYSVRCVKF